MLPELDLNPMGLDNSPTYFYRVSEFLMTLGSERKSFSDTKDFKDTDLLKARSEALAYYFERHNGIQAREQFFGKQLVTPNAEFDNEQSACFSINLYLVEFYSSEDEMEHDIFEDENSFENERYILESLGLELV